MRDKYKLNIQSLFDFSGIKIFSLFVSTFQNNQLFILNLLLSVEYAHVSSWSSHQWPGPQQSQWSSLRTLGINGPHPSSLMVSVFGKHQKTRIHTYTVHSQCKIIFPAFQLFTNLKPTEAPKQKDGRISVLNLNLLLRLRFVSPLLIYIFVL